MTDPKLIEIVARAFRAYGFTSAATKRAGIALAAINASGTHWVAPVEATPKMIADGLEEACVEDPRTIKFTWAAMRDAYLAEPKA